MNCYFVVCDGEEDYVMRFTALLNEKQWMPYQIEGLTSVDGLADFCTGHRVETLLIEEELYREEMTQLDIGKIWLLSGMHGLQPDRRKSSGVDDRTLPERIFKYQPVEEIVRQILARTPPPEKELTAGSARRRIRMEVLGVYSPVRNSQKTLFALALGIILAKERKTVYLSYESFAGLTELLPGERKGDLSDVFYLTEHKKGAFSTWKQQCVGTMGNLDYILPVPSPLDLHGAADSDFLSVLDILEKEGAYQTVVLEFDESCKAFLKVLERCDRIYMPTGQDVLSLSQMSQYEQFLRAAGKPEVLEKSHHVRPPYYNGLGSREQYLEQLVWGELGDYVRSLL